MRFGPRVRVVMLPRCTGGGHVQDIPDETGRCTQSGRAQDIRDEPT